MSSMLRAAIIGAGMMGIQHAEAIRRVPGVEIVAIADSDYGLAQRVSRKLCIPKAYADYQKMFQEEHIDAIHICTPNNTHFAIASEAIRRRIHVYCEKPLAISSRQSADLCDLSELYGVENGVNFVYRHNVMLQDMRERIQGRDWGRTLLIRGEYLQDWMLYDSDYNWRCIPELNGPSRTIADIGSHLFDAIQYITGQRITRVYAKLFTVHAQRKMYSKAVKTFEQQTDEQYTMADITSEDAAHILFELEDNVPGVFTISQVSAGYKNGMRISVDGSRYSMVWEQESPDKLWIGTREQGKTMVYAAAGGMHGDANLYSSLPAGHAVGWADALKNGVNAFYSKIRKADRRRFPNFQDGNYILKLVDACLESNKSNCWISVGGID